MNLYASHVGDKVATYKLRGYFPWLRPSMIMSLLLKLVMDTKHGDQQLLMVSHFVFLSLGLICSAMKTSVHLLRVIIIDVYGIPTWYLLTVSRSWRSFVFMKTPSILFLIRIKNPSLNVRHISFVADFYKLLANQVGFVS